MRCDTTTRASCSTTASRSVRWPTTSAHADPGFTLRVYCHLMPDSEDRARQAVDAALGCEPDVSQEAADEAFPQVRPLRDQMS